MTNNKQSIKELVIEQRKLVIESVNIFIAKQNRLETEYDKYFAEITKRSDKFKLTKVQDTFDRDVRYRHNGKSIVVDRISGTYNKCVITYCGELPEGESAYIDIAVEEQFKRSRRSYWSESQGFKLKLNINYDGERYYKSVGTFIKTIEDFVKEKWDSFNRNQRLKQQQELAHKVAKEKFDGDVNIYYDYIIVNFSNGVKIKYHFDANLEKNDVVFSFASVDLRSLTSSTNPEVIIDLSNRLGSL